MKQYARYTLRSPKKIDFMAIQKAVHGAGYTIKDLEMEVSGVAQRKACPTCRKQSLFLRVEKTGQLIEIDGDVPLRRHLRIRAAGSEWGKDFLGRFAPKKHVVLKVMKVLEEREEREEREDGGPSSSFGTRSRPSTSDDASTPHSKGPGGGGGGPSRKRKDRV